MSELKEPAQEVKKFDNLEDVLAHAQEKGVILPKKQIEYMRTGLESKKVGAEFLAKIVDRVAEKKDAVGLQWRDKPESMKDAELKEQKEKGTDHAITVAKYQDRNGLVHAYIKEATIKNSQDPEKIGKTFYSANRIEHGKGDMPGTDKHVVLTTSYSLDGVKNQVASYYAQIHINQVQQEFREERQKQWELKAEIQNEHEPEKKEPEMPSPSMQM